MVPTTPGFLYAREASFFQNEEEKNNQKEGLEQRDCLATLLLFPYIPTHPPTNSPTIQKPQGRCLPYMLC